MIAKKKIIFCKSSIARRISCVDNLTLYFRKHNFEFRKLFILFSGKNYESFQNFTLILDFLQDFFADDAVSNEAVKVL